MLHEASAERAIFMHDKGTCMKQQHSAKLAFQLILSRFSLAAAEMRAAVSESFLCCYQILFSTSSSHIADAFAAEPLHIC